MSVIVLVGVHVCYAITDLVLTLERNQVPFADLFNHRTDGEHLHFTGTEEDSEDEGDSSDKEGMRGQQRENECGDAELVMQTVLAAKKGLEVFNTYGNIGSAPLLVPPTLSVPPPLPLHPTPRFLLPPSLPPSPLLFLSLSHSLCMKYVHTGLCNHVHAPLRAYMHLGTCMYTHTCIHAYTHVQIRYGFANTDNA